MESPLGKRLLELRQLGDASAYNEEQAKHSIILPILSSLGWEVFNREQVVAEFSIEPEEKDGSKERVDYCLKISGRNEVFIEAKRPGESLENHAHQLLNYAFRYGVRLAALTTGIEWWLYLPLSIGSWSERRFAVIDIREERAPEQLEAFLGREAVATAAALRAAQEAILENALPRAWTELCQQLRGSLVEALARKLKDLTGYEPDRHRLGRFVDDCSRAKGQPETETISIPIPSPGETPGPESNGEAYWSRESPWTLETAKDFLTIVKPLIADADLNFAEGYVAIAGRRGNYFSFSKRASDRSLLWVRVLPTAVEEAAAVLEKAGLPCTRGPSNVQLVVDKEKVKSNAEVWKRIARFPIDYWKS